MLDADAPLLHRLRVTRLPFFPILVLGFVLGCVHAQPPEEAMMVARLGRTTADDILQPGDFLFRYVDPSDPLEAQITNAVIQAGQVTVASAAADISLTEQAARDLFGADDQRFEDALVAGDPNAVHMAIYLGDGETAEAFGTSLDDPKVGVWNLFAPYRNRTAWRVLRHRDPEVHAAIADVARRWATGRMGYAPPFEVFVQGASWGDHARATALDFANAYDTPGGPPQVTSMFCSQFAVAALQSAMARVLLPVEGALVTEDLEALPVEARIDAVASPLHVYGAWSRSGAFALVGRIVLDTE